MKRFSVVLVLAVFACASTPQPPIDPPDYDTYTLAVTEKDANGYWNASIEFPNQPVPINAEQDYTGQVVVDLNKVCNVYQVSSFNGLDRGDIVEMDTFVYDQTGRVLYQRSKHKETLSDFDSFEVWPTIASTKLVSIHMHAHVTDPTEPARAHWNVTVWCGPGEDTEPPPDTCEAQCAPGQHAIVNDQCRCSKDYYVMSQAENLHEEALNWDARLIYDGYRNPLYARENCGDSVLPYKGFTSWGEINPVMDRSLEAKTRLYGADGTGGYYSNLLKHNRHFTGRSMVYKPDAAPWFSEARELLNGTGTNSTPNGPVSKLNGIKKACEDLQ